ITASRAAPRIREPSVPSATRDARLAIRPWAALPSLIVARVPRSVHRRKDSARSGGREEAAERREVDAVAAPAVVAAHAERLAVGHERLDLGAVERGEAREHALLAARAPEVDARVGEPGEVHAFEDALRERARIGVQLAEDAREVAEVLEAFGEDGEGAARVL